MFFKKAIPSLFLLMVMNVSFAEQAKPAINVVTTFSILSDLVRQIGGQKVQVYSLVGMDENAHVFNPSPVDVRRVAGSDLLVVNGLGFEGWLDRMVAAAKYMGQVVTVSDGIKAIVLDTDDKHHHVESLDIAHDKNKIEVYDPHAWQSIQAVKIYINNITQALMSVDEKNADFYHSNMLGYLSALEEFQDSINKRMALIPADRNIVMPHNALAYLARDYDLHIHSLQGLSSMSEASALHIAKVIRKVRRLNIKAIFAENISDERLIKLVQRETGVNVGGALITGALSKKLAPTYLEMMRYNMDLILKALTPSNLTQISN